MVVVALAAVTNLFRNWLWDLRGGSVGICARKLGLWVCSGMGGLLVAGGCLLKLFSVGCGSL